MSTAPRARRLNHIVEVAYTEEIDLVNPQTPQQAPRSPRTTNTAASKVTVKEAEIRAFNEQCTAQLKALKAEEARLKRLATKEAKVKAKAPIKRSNC